MGHLVHSDDSQSVGLSENELACRLIDAYPFANNHCVEKVKCTFAKVPSFSNGAVGKQLVTGRAYLP